MFVDKFPDLANVFAGGLIVGQALDRDAPSLWLFSLGMIAWVLFMGAAFMLAEDPHDRS